MASKSGALKVKEIVHGRRAWLVEAIRDQQTGTIYSHGINEIVFKGPVRVGQGGGVSTQFTLTTSYGFGVTSKRHMSVSPFSLGLHGWWNNRSLPAQDEITRSRVFKTRKAAEKYLNGCELVSAVDFTMKRALFDRRYIKKLLEPGPATVQDKCIFTNQMKSQSTGALLQIEELHIGAKVPDLRRVAE